jgi:hypothetical protein
MKKRVNNLLQMWPNIVLNADAPTARRLTSALALWENPCHLTPRIIKRHSAFQAICSACFAVSLGFRLQTGLLVCNLFPTSLAQRFFMGCAGHQDVAFFCFVAKV